MRGTKVKAISKYMRDYNNEVLLFIRQEFDSRTEDMTQRSIYRNMKRLYNNGKFQLPRNM